MREASPRTSDTCRFATPSAAAMVSTKLGVRRPSTGGAARCNDERPLAHGRTTRLCFARGRAWTSKRTAPSVVVETFGVASVTASVLVACGAMSRLRWITAGESHGPRLTAIVEGVPAGLPLLAEDIDVDLARRQRGYGRGGRMKIETDRVEFVGGVRGGETLGSPIAMLDHEPRPRELARPHVARPPARSAASRSRARARATPTSREA